jgi:transposase
MPKPSPNETPPDASARETRFTASRKIDIVVRLLRGESLDAVSRETGLPAGRILEWRDDFVAAGKDALKSRGPQPAGITDEQRRDMQAKIGEITMENELLRAKISHMEANLPPGQRRSKR